MTIIDFSETHRTALADLLLNYLPEVDADIPEDIVRGKLMDMICRQNADGIIHVCLAVSQGNIAGFSIFQIDAPASDWCKRPGWGFVREFYVAPSFRGRGFGRALAEHAEHTLRSLGAKQLYLTSDGSIAFWQRCGWQLTHEIASNGLIILEK